MANPQLRVYDYITRVHPANEACSHEACAETGHRTSLGPGNLLQDKENLYVKNSLSIGDRPFHSRITKWYREDPKQPACFREDVIRRIQDVHNAVLRSVSAALTEGGQLPEGQAIDPTRIAIRLVDDQQTEIVVIATGQVIKDLGGRELLQEDRDLIISTEAKTIHTAMKYLRDHVLMPSRFSGGNLISPFPLSSLSRGGPRPMPPIAQGGGTPRAESSPSPEESEEEEGLSAADVEGAADVLLGKSDYDGRKSPAAPSAGESVPMIRPLTSLQQAMVARMDTVRLRADRPQGWPEQVSFGAFRRRVHPELWEAFLQLVRSPESVEGGPRTVRNLFVDWLEQGYQAYRDRQPARERAGPTYKQFLRDYAAEDNERAYTYYLKYQSFMEWFLLLNCAGESKENIDRLQLEILNLSI